MAGVASQPQTPPSPPSQATGALTLIGFGQEGGAIFNPTPKTTWTKSNAA